MSIDSNQVLNLYMNDTKTETVSNEMVISEIFFLLEEIGCNSDENWIILFIQDFLNRGIDAIHAYESHLGNEKIKKLQNRIQQSETLKIYNRNFISKIALKNNNDQNPASLVILNSYPTTNSGNVTEKEALAELKIILNNCGYYENDDEPWVREFIKLFRKSGLRALDKFEPKFGKKDRNEIEKLICDSENLQIFCLCLSDENTTRDDGGSIEVDTNEEAKEKSIVVLGATGAGKSSVSLKPTSNKSFREIIVKRDELKSEIIRLNLSLGNSIKVKKHFEKLLNEVRNKENSFNNQIDISPYNDISYEVIRKVPTEYYNTCCTYCSAVCHENCSLQEISTIGNNRFKYCKAFLSSEDQFYYNFNYAYISQSDFCKKCGHSYKHHVHSRHLYKREILTKKVFDPRFTARMNEEKNMINQKQEIMEYFDKQAKEINEEIKNSQIRIFKALDTLNSLCSNFNIMKEIDLIKEMLDEKIKDLNQKVENSRDQNDMEDLDIGKETQKIIMDILKKWVSKSLNLKTNF
jgi:hypothetical protein